MKVVNHFIKTKSLYSDGRMLKWMNSMANIGVMSHVFSIEDQPTNFTHPQVVNFPVHIFLRHIFPIGSGRLLKIVETLIKGFFIILKSRSKNWLFHDNQFYHLIIVSILLKKFGIKRIRLIWDLHELPHGYFLNNLLGKRILKWMYQNCDLILVTNEDRKTYLEELLDLRLAAVLLRNYPLKNDILSPEVKLNSLSKSKKWIEQGDFALWLGSASLGRGFEVFYKWVCQNKLNLVILGNVSSTFNHIKNNENVFVDFVKQSDLSAYVFNAKVSAVFYKPYSPNNWLCEPNRLYQLMAAGVFVIVGNNPPILRETQDYYNKLVVNYEEFDLSGFTEVHNNKVFSRQAAQDFMIEKGKYWEFDFNVVAKKIVEIMNIPTIS